jgi:hypothetical protein
MEGGGCHTFGPPTVTLFDRRGHLCSEDKTLFEIKVHEDAFTSQLKTYLSFQFPDCDVDHNYNRNLKNKKKIDTNAGPEDILPDIIIHERMTSKNLLAIEVKKDIFLTDKEKLEDFRKLKALREQSNYQYRHAVFIILMVEKISWKLHWVD